ncbi:glycosyltransferase family 2 protein [Cycloclasticus sp.]|uniref:glycosyltransferase family 2 protein n=1 Tax=Cycloclasticus sp. TaxID=2024830 RepID=UPI00257B5D4E|nr:glycosyltransferase family 2 protein [Cycloclasticus sp.]
MLTTNKVAAITTARNDPMFIEKWVRYYGDQFGRKNLYIFLDGHDQDLPKGAAEVNRLFLPHTPLNRVPADRRRARLMSDFARGLFRYYDSVIVTDVDEFLIVDPDLNIPLPEYLLQIKKKASVSALGLDVGQHLETEDALDVTRPFLGQRKYAHLSSRYTKPSIAFRPVTWGSGMHRIKGKNFSIDPNLFLFHFGMLDYQLSVGKTACSDRLKSGWAGHLFRRKKLFQVIAEATPIEGDTCFEAARRYQTWHRPVYALNKPRQIPGNPVVIIPDRFRYIV